MTIAEKLTTIAENEQRVYNAGYNAGKALNYNDGYEAGKQAEYDTIWDGIQNNGERSNYFHGFANAWTKETFKPKYSVITSSGTTVANNVFYLFNNGLTASEIESKAIDLVEVAEEQGIVFDFTKARQMVQTFETGGIKRIGALDLTKKTNLANTFNQREPFSLYQIDKIISDATTAWDSTGTFGNCRNLTHCIFEGVIAKSGLNISAATKLDKDSITSIINCLSSTTSGFAIRVSEKAVAKAFENLPGDNDGVTSPAWETLVRSKSNWTISLA